jgi:mRNA-degrading endonuclease RelE of RelBE toxin-antitoxin system
MTWTFELSAEAERELAALPHNVQRQIAKAIDDMQIDPFSGDVKPLKGKAWKGRFRRRVGRYRIIFTPYHSQRYVEISAILLRSEKTYRS